MSSINMIDIVLAIVLLGFVIAGAKKGLFKTLMGLVATLAALVGAALLSGMLANPVTDMVYPLAEEFLAEQMQQIEVSLGEVDIDFSALADQIGQPEVIVEIPGFAAFSETLRGMGISEESIRELLEDSWKSSVSVVERAAYMVLRTAVQAVLFLLLFIVLNILLHIAVNALNLVFYLPLLSTVNALGGALLRMIEALMLIFIVLYFAPRMGITYFADNAEGTLLLSFFMTHSPKTLLALFSK